MPSPKSKEDLDVLSFEREYPPPNDQQAYDISDKNNGAMKTNGFKQVKLPAKGQRQPFCTRATENLKIVAQNVMASAFSFVFYLVSQQFGARIVTFLINVLIARKVFVSLVHLLELSF